MNWLLRVIPTPYLIVGIVAIAAATHLAAGYAGWKVRDNSARAQAQKETEQKLSELAVLNDKIIEMQREARAVEAFHAVRLTQVSESYQEKIRDAEIDKDKFVAGVRDGSIRMQLPRPHTERTNTSVLPEVVVTASRCDAAPGSELPSAVSEFLYSEAARADKIVEQLTACQAIVREDRRICGSNIK